MIPRSSSPPATHTSQALNTLSHPLTRPPTPSVNPRSLNTLSDCTHSLGRLQRVSVLVREFTGRNGRSLANVTTDGLQLHLIY